MALTRTYTKTIVNKNKFTELVSAYDNYDYWSAFGDQLTVHLTTDFTTQQETDLDALISGWVDFTTAESLKVYLHNTVFPFIDDLITKFAAENIALGITQAGKTADVLGLFEKQYDIGALHPVSLKGSFDTGSLYVALDIIQHVRDNTAEYTGLSPFVTDARLLEMKNDIEVFLDITPLST